jgi:hypothetical protein
MTPEIAAILEKHWLDGGVHDADPEPLTGDEVRLLEDELPDEYCVEDFYDRGGDKWWHWDTWYDFRGDDWLRDEYGKVYR